MILITGGMGFIGLHTARSFLDAGEPVVLTRFRAWRLPRFLEGELGTQLQVEPLDLADGWAVLDLLRRRSVTSIVHLAAPAPGSSPAQSYRSGLLGLINVLEAARQHGVRRVSLASSVSVYANAGPGPWREEMPLPMESDGHIAAEKKAMEALALHFADRTGVDVRIMRLAMIYGPLYHSMANLPSRLCLAAVRGQPPRLDDLRVGTPYAQETADLCYVRDCAAGIRSLHLSDRLSHRVYNVGGGRAVTNQELAEAVRKAIPTAEVSLPSCPPRPDARQAYMDISRIQQDTGYAPRYDLINGVADYVAWLREEPQ
ncbi:MAG TPA: NAD(P)-dependent oxidoreductase [Candidatus Dormibacteraeota bacterium]|nr:NAD(P)-dependent oxidoreductase [Candidatus Dormibacteraeota bacterium]